MVSSREKLLIDLTLLLEEYEDKENIIVGCIVSFGDLEYTFDGERFIETK